MPIFITNKNFFDPFNTTPYNSLDNMILSDEITTTVNLEYRNVIDASLFSGSIIEGEDSDNLNLTAQGINISNKQCFIIDDAIASNYPNEITEYRSQALQSTYNGDLPNAEIEMQNKAGATLGTFTILNAGTYQGNYIIICNEAASLTGNYNNNKIVVKEAFTASSVDYAVINTSRNSPTIEISSQTAATFETTSANLDASSAVVENIPFKLGGAYQTGFLTIQGQGITDFVVGSSTATAANQAFEYIHNFKVTPISVYVEGTNREPQDFNGTNNAKYVGLFSTSSSNAYYLLDIHLKNQVTGGIDLNVIDVLRPDVAVFEQNYLKNDSEYTVTNLSIVRESDSESSGVPLIAAKFTVAFDLENTEDSPFSDANTLVQVGIENLPINIDNSENYIQTFLSDSALTTLGSAPINGVATGDAASITNYETTFNSTDSISVSFDVEFNAAAQTQINLNSQKYFSIYCVTQNHTLDNTNSDRSIINVFRGEGVQNLIDTNPVNTNFGIIEFPETEVTISVSSAECYPADNLVAKHLFNLDWTNRENLRINTITNKVILKNTVTDEVIELDSSVIPVSSFSLIDDLYPQANYSANRGYQIPSDEVRNNITLINRADLDAGDVHNFEMNYPFKVKHQDWQAITLQNIPAELIDQNEPNNGLNNFWYRLQTITDWRIFHRVVFDMTDSQISFSQEFDNQLTLYDYESNIHSVSYSIRSFTEDGAVELIDGSDKLLNKDGKTMIVTSLELDESVADFEVEIFAERKEQGTDTTIERLSSINGRSSGSWFEGITDINFVDKEINSNFVIGKGLINGFLIPSSDEFEVYAKYYIALNKKTESGDVKETESDENKIID